MKALLIVFLFTLPCVVFGNNKNDNYGSIRGIILTSDGYPAAYVGVLLKNTGKGTITDDSGNFEIKKIKPGTYTLRFSLLEYNDHDTVVVVMQNETALLNIQLHSTIAQLKNVIVTTNLASKYVVTKPSESLHLDLPLNEIPQNITVINSQILADQGLLTMTEAIRNVSGVVKSYGGLNDNYLIIRGTEASWNVFRNGVGGFVWTQQEDIAMLEKIEFVKGPAGFMLNFAEPGGIVNNVTKQPVKERITNIDAAFGSYNMLRITADIGGSFSKASKFSYRFNAGIQRQDRAFQFSTASRHFICAALKYDLNKKTSLTAEYNYIKGKTFGNNDHLPSLNGKMFALPANFAAADADTDSTITNNKYYRLHFSHTFSENWQLNAQLAYVNGTWGGNQLETDGYTPVSKDTLYRTAFYNDWRLLSKVAQVFMDGKFNTGSKMEHKVLLGVDYCNAGFTNDWAGTFGEKKYGLYLPDPRYYVNPDSLKNFDYSGRDEVDYGWTALYVQDHIKISGKLVVTIAGRFTHTFQKNNWSLDYQRDNKYNVFTPRAGLTWLCSNDVSVYAMYDQSFWPQFGENLEQKPFEPLTGYNIETGVKSYFFKKKLGCNLSVYHIVKNNTLTDDPLHPDPFYYIQTGQVTSRGIDVDITGNITPSITVNANYAYTDAKITKDSNPKNVGLKNPATPDHYGNLWVRYNVLKGLLKNISFAMGYQYMGKRSAIELNSAAEEMKFLPVHNLFDAALSYSNEKLNISLNVYNITNINYAVFGYFNPDINEWRYTPGEPVNFRLSFGVNLPRIKKDK